MCIRLLGHYKQLAACAFDILEWGGCEIFMRGSAGGEVEVDIVLTMGGGVLVCVCVLCAPGGPVYLMHDLALCPAASLPLPFLFLPLLFTWLDLFSPLPNDFCSLHGRTTSPPYLVYSW